MASRRDLTERDLTVLRFAVEQFALPMAVVAEVARPEAGPDGGAPEGFKPSRRGGRRNDGAADAVARRIAGRLEARRLAQRERVGGQTWLVPRGRGLAMAAEAEDPYELWRPIGWRLQHVETVARLRLYLADRHPEAAWESERSIRRRLAEADRQAAVKLGYRVPDGGLHWPDGTATAIECELTLKKPHEYAQVLRDSDQAAWTGGCWWFTRPGRVAWLQARLAKALAVDHEVRPLPEGVAW